MTTGVERIAAERQRQIDAEGWTSEHDDTHIASEMAIAAVCYAAAAANERIFTVRQIDYLNEREYRFRDPWPWETNWDKRPTTTPSLTERIRMLEKAGALIAAEIDRLERIYV